MDGITSTCTDSTASSYRRLTSGTFPVLKVVAVDDRGGWVYFTGHAEPRLYDTHIYRIGLDGKGFARLTDAPGQHSAVFSPSKAFFLDSHSHFDRPPRIDLRQADGKLLQTLSTGDIEALRDLKWTPPEEFTVKAADGTTALYGVLYKPYDFDPTRKYPIVEYIYGGPQTTNAPRTFTGAGYPLALAQLGFITFVLDARGTPERSKAFQDVVYGNFGRHEIPDHVAGLKQLAAARPYIDLASRRHLRRIVGGLYDRARDVDSPPMSITSGCRPIRSSISYDHWGLIEATWDSLRDNRAGYDYASSLRLADRLKGKLMLIHGTSDTNATFSSTMKMVEALTRAGKPYDLIVFPELNHGIGGIQTYWQDAQRRYFQEHLKP